MSLLQIEPDAAANAAEVGVLPREADLRPDFAGDLGARSGVDELAVLRRALDRERHARRQVEELLESRSRELYSANDELAQQAAELIRSEETIRSIIHTTNDAFLMTDAAGAVKQWSIRAERLFGWKRREAMGRNLRELILPDVSGGANPLQVLLGESRTGKREIATATTSSGGRLPVEFSISPLLLDGQFVFTAFAHDVSHRQTMQAQLAHAQKMESVGQLAAGIAHEINTPIQYVGDNIRFLSDAFADVQKLLDAYRALADRARHAGLGEELLAEIDRVADDIDLPFLEEETPQAVRQASDGVQRVAQIVGAMKDFSHPGSKEKTRIDLNRAIRSTTTVCRNEWKYVADLQLQLDPSLPLVPCLPGEFNQTILNLVVNAAHAVAERLGPQATRKGTILVTSERRDREVVVRVIDSGIGIPPENLGQIFNPFFTTKGVGRGTGQGLAIAYSAIVEKHGGRLEVESQVGVGATFSVTLPVDEASVSLAVPPVGANP